MVFKIWDLRQLSEKADIEMLRQKLSQVEKPTELVNEQNIHPKLGWARLRVKLDAIMYCVEYEDRLWPEDQRPK